MKKAVMLTGAFLLLLGVSGCGGETHDKLVTETIQVIKEAGQVMEGIKDDKTAKEKAGDLKSVGKRLADLKKRAYALKEPLNKEEKDRLSEKYKTELTKAYERTAKQWDRIKKIPGVQDALKGSLDDFGYTK